MQRRWARTIRFLLAWAILACSVGTQSRSFSPADAPLSAEIAFVVFAGEPARTTASAPVAAPRVARLRARQPRREAPVAAPSRSVAEEPKTTTRYLVLVPDRYLRNSAFLC